MWVTTDAAGAFTIRGLGEGTKWSLFVRDGANRYPLGSDLEAGSTDLEIRLP